MVDNILVLVHFILIGFAIISAFRFPIVSPALLVASIGMGYYQGFLGIEAVIILIGFYFIAFLISKDMPKWLNVGLHLIFIAICIGLAAHVLPGFKQYVIQDQVQKSALSQPFDLRVNIDKFHVFFGVLLACRTYVVPYVVDNRRIQYIFLTIAALGLLQYLTIPLGLMSFDFQVPQWMPYWFLMNLLLTCPAEEAFFRAYIQRGFHNYMKPMNAILLASVVFGLAHFAGGPLFMVFAALAGAGYGLVYFLTGGSLLAAVAIHFLFNLSHLAFFTYPLPM